MSKPALSAEPSSETPSLEIIERVASLEETDPLALPPLYDTIDPDALDSLVQSSAADGARTESTIRFTYCGYDVRVGADGGVVVSE
ncbi:HalOD1 output domain-containing protein [Haloterrigena turkmenica]|nr:HalOD1 output domain-containing protein [Haloterrigena turkmenica]